MVPWELCLCEVLKEAMSFIEIIEDAGMPTIANAISNLQQIIQETMQDAGKAKVLLMELLLALAMQKVVQKRTDENIAELKALVSAHNVFFSANLLNLKTTDLHPRLWKIAQEWANKEKAQAVASS